MDAFRKLGAKYFGQLRSCFHLAAVVVLL
jgi:hypothetical protein